VLWGMKGFPIESRVVPHVGIVLWFIVSEFGVNCKVIITPATQVNHLSTKMIV
jgi:hypothetical protein